MNNKNIINQIKTLRKVKPDLLWKNSNRELLISQIGFEHKESEQKVNVLTEVIKDLAMDLKVYASRPGVFVVMLALIALGGPIYAAKNLNKAKPGDSLYIAKIVSEKAQLALTFNQVEKAKLGLEFAENRTREIAKVLVQFNKDRQEKDTKVQKLTNDFKGEINKIKEYEVVKESKIKTDLNTEKITSAVKQGENKSNDEIDSTIILDDDETKVFSAYLGRAKDGIQLTEKEFHKVLDDATGLIESKDYVGTLNKLEEASAIIETVEDNAILDVDNKDLSLNSEIHEIVDLLQAKENIKSTSTKEQVNEFEIQDGQQLETFDLDQEELEEKQMQIHKVASSSNISNISTSSQEIIEQKKQK